MLISKLCVSRTKDVPSDAKMISHKLMLRAGYIKQVSNGIYTLSPLGAKACLNIENIINGKEGDSSVGKLAVGGEIIAGVFGELELSSQTSTIKNVANYADLEIRAGGKEDGLVGGVIGGFYLCDGNTEVSNMVNYGSMIITGGTYDDDFDSTYVQDLSSLNDEEEMSSELDY